MSERERSLFVRKSDSPRFTILRAETRGEQSGENSEDRRDPSLNTPDEDRFYILGE
ncbi:hypothetical protein [Desulfohalovibrio reitneri]|uniref:hypothetical protein n=1 Tax=Desulfohalovibrio reitneri TaxID=1307759 RepID=UPI000B2E8BBC|nr:hypothetical protein [Desulfohalovibrio reitneri]